MANSSMFVFPRVTIPALLSFDTTVALYGDTKVSNILEPHVVLIPFVQKISLWAIGIPSRGFFSPFASRWSAIFA